MDTRMKGQGAGEEEHLVLFEGSGAKQNLTTTQRRKGVKGLVGVKEGTNGSWGQSPRKG